MNVTSPLRGVAGIVFILCFALVSCETETGPKPGSPGFFWYRARDTAGQGDLVKTLEHVDKVASAESEYKARAQVWLLVLSSGLSRGYADLADGFEAGGRSNKANPGAFRKYVSAHRGTASRLALQFAEVLGRFEKGAEENIPLAFPYPSGSAAAVAGVNKVSGGVMLTAAEMPSAEKQSIERGVLLAASRAAGAGEDTAKAQDVFKAPNPQVARGAFFLSMAQTLYDQSQLYGRTKIDDPEKLKIFCTRALDLLKKAPEGKPAKDLTAKINAALKQASRR